MTAVKLVVGPNGAAAADAAADRAEAVAAASMIDVGFASLTLAITAAAAAGRRLIITQDWAIASDTTVNVPILVDGGSFTVNSGRTLAFTRSFEGDWDRIFFGTGAVTGLRHVRGEWWGATGSGSVNDQPAMQEAANVLATSGIASVKAGPQLYELAGHARYRLDTPLRFVVSATCPLIVRGSGDVLSTRFVSPSGATGSQVIHIDAAVGSINRIVDFDVSGFSVEIQSGSGVTTGVQIGRTGGTPETPRAQTLKGVNKSKIYNVHVDGAGIGFAQLDASQVLYERCASWNTVDEAHIGFLFRASNGWACGDSTLQDCQVVGRPGGTDRNGVLLDCEGGGYLTGVRLNGMIIEDCGYSVRGRVRAGGSLGDIWITGGPQADGDLDPLTAGRGIYFEIEDTTFANSAIQNVNIDQMYLRGLEAPAVEFKTTVGGIRHINVNSPFIANHTGTAMRFEGVRGLVINGVRAEEVSGGGNPLIDLQGACSEVFVDGVELVQATAITVRSLVRVASTVSNFVIEGVVAAANTVTNGLVEDLTGASTRKQIATVEGMRVITPGSTTSRTVEERFSDMIWARDYGTVGDGVANDSAALALACAALPYGGTVYIHPDDIHLIDTTLVVPKGVKIMGQLALPGIPGEGNSEASQIWDLRSRLVINTAATIQLEGNAGLIGLFLLRKGMTGPENSAAAYAGTAITVSGEDTLCRDLLAIGFNRIWDCNGFQRAICENIRWDAVNGFRSTNTFDIPRWRELHGWPFGTIDAPAPVTTFGTGHYLFRNGTAYRLEGLNDWFEADNCFAYGYMNGFDINGPVSVFLFKCAADNISQSSAPYVVANTRGFLIQGTTDELSMVQCHAAAQDFGIDLFPSVSTAQIDLNGFSGWGLKSAGIRAVNPCIVKLSNGFVRGLNTAYPGVGGTGVVNFDPAGRIVFDKTFSIEQFANAIDMQNAPGGMIGAPYVQDGAIINTALPTLASAATINPSPNYNVVRITGTTNIGTIAPTYAGHQITLIFAASLTVFSTLSGSTTTYLEGGADFNATANDTLTLVCNGTIWLQAGRSVN